MRIRIFCAAFFIAVSVLATLNWIVDPYAAHDHGLTKFFDAFRHHPVMEPRAKLALLESGRCERVIVGSSRAEFAFDPRHPRFRDVKTCNLGVSASSIREQILIADKALSRPEVRELIWSFDFGAFHRNFGIRQELTAQNLLKRLSQLASWSMTHDSIRLLSRYFTGRRSGYTPDGYLDVPAFTAWPITRFRNDWSLYKSHPALYRKFELDRAALSEIQKLFFKAKERGIAARSVVLPVHVSHLAFIRRLGADQSYVEWISMLREVTEGAQLVDFTSVDPPNDETVSLDGKNMQWFWDSNHVTAEYGNFLTEALFSDRRLPAAVTPETAKNRAVAMFRSMVNWEMLNSATMKRMGL